MHMENIHQAKTNLSKLIEEALAGEKVVICKAGKPLVTLTPYQEPKQRIPGLLEGQIYISEDFEEDLPESIMKAFRGESD